MRCCFALVVAVAVTGACGSETTSFRPIDHIDARRPGPPSTTYDLAIAGELVGKAHVWSSGGYLSSSGEPMTHVGFELKNATLQALTFDADVLELAVFDLAGTALPPARFTRLMPLGPSLITVAPGGMTMFATYFQLPVQPRAVERMQVRWTLRKGADEYQQVTAFVRDGSESPAEAPPPAAQPTPRS